VLQEWNYSQRNSTYFEFSKLKFKETSKIKQFPDRFATAFGMHGETSQGDQMLKFAWLLVFVAVPSVADPFPTYQFFYTCASGVVDCGNFDRNDNNLGDFGMTGIVPTNWPAGQPTGGLNVLMSNKEGQVLGYAASTTGNAIVYGFDGHVTCVGGCNDENFQPEGINDNGLFLFNGPPPCFPYGCIGFGSQANSALPPAIEALTDPGVVDLVNFTLPGAVDNTTLLGINDQNQILLTYDFSSGQSITGVLSPSTVPEPPSVALLITAIGVCGALRRRRVPSK
jgi:hypothetical protein